MKVEIKSFFGSLLFTTEAESIKDALLKDIKEGFLLMKLLIHRVILMILNESSKKSLQKLFTVINKCVYLHYISKRINV